MKKKTMIKALNYFSFNVIARRRLRRRGNLLRPWPIRNSDGDSRFRGNDGLFGLLLCALLLISASSAFADSPQWNDDQPIKVRMGEYTYKLEVAQSPEKQAEGLMYRKSLRKRRGMIFPFSPPQPVTFWMKHCQMSLDMIFVRAATPKEQAKSPNLIGIIDGISPNRPPCPMFSKTCPTYSSPGPVIAVIELAGGQSKRYGLRKEMNVLLKK